MSPVVVTIIVVGVATLAARVWRLRMARGSVRHPNLRLAVLGREMTATGGSTNPPDIRAAVMDWGVGTGVATLVAFHDGTLSLYTDTGGGILGGGAHESARRAGAQFLAALTQQISALRPTDSFAAPDKDQVIFWLVEDQRTLSSGPIPVAALHSASDPMAAAGNAAQAAITALREVTTARKGGDAT